MTEPAEATNVGASPPPRPRLLPVLAAPALIFLGIVVPFLRFQEYNLLLPESLMLMALAALIGVALGGAALLRPATLTPTLTTIALCIFALYRSDIREPVFHAADAIASLTGGPNIVLALTCAFFFVALMIVCRLLGRHLQTTIIVVFGVFLVGTLVLPTPTGGRPEITGALPAKLNDLPPVIHIILDEHAGLAALPAEVEESAAAAEAIRSTYKDFALYSRAYSRFGETHLSLASLMNAVSGPDVLSHLDRNGLTHVITDNRWFDQLKAQGYAVHVYQSTWLDMCSDSDAVDVCYTYPLYSINPLQRTPIPKLKRLSVLLGKLHIGSVDALPAPMASMEAIARFRADLAQNTRGVAYVVHLILPHYGYLFRSDCSFADPSEWANQPGREGFIRNVSAEERDNAYHLYLAQLVCTERQIAGVFQQLKDAGAFEDATIIVHGDHGSRIAEGTTQEHVNALTERDLLDHVGTLLAIKEPGLPAGLRETPAALQQVFAETFLKTESLPAEPGLLWLRDVETQDLVERRLVWPDYSDEAGRTNAEVSSAFSASPLRQLRPGIE